MTVNILLFATLKDKAGAARLVFPLERPESTIRDVKTALESRFPGLQGALGSAVASVNREFAFPDDPVHEGDEIAFFPPVSGGAPPNAEWPTVYQLADTPISIDALTAQITTAETGAICVFSGVVRGETHTAHGVERTDKLEYEAYWEMALLKMQQVTQEIRARYPGVQGIAVVQRIGVLEVGTPTVLIACASGHRDGGCFEAARYGIDRLKEIVPVWKKEDTADARPAAWIEGGYQPTAADRHEP